MTAHPDPNRIGGLAWTRRTNGRLTRRERLQLLGSVAASQRDYFLHRLRRDRPSATPRPGERDIRPPDSRFAREVEAAAAEQNPVLVTHGYRSWIFGRALADVDGISVPVPESWVRESVRPDADHLQPGAPFVGTHRG